MQLLLHSCLKYKTETVLSEKDKFLNLWSASPIISISKVNYPNIGFIGQEDEKMIYIRGFDFSRKGKFNQFL